MATKYMDITEFREEGYLQELNRRFLHPLGLALEVVQEKDGREYLGGIWDFRDDPEGLIFDDDVLKADRIAAIDSEWQRRGQSRLDGLGYVLQPVAVEGEGNDDDGPGQT